MAETRIEWADAVWNPVTGCSPVSEGCENCYARRFAHRMRGRFGYPADEPFRVVFHEDRVVEPLNWRKPRRIFVCSMGDLFHEDVDPYNIMRIFNVMAAAKQHTFLVLTKRPQRMLEVYRRLRRGTVIPGPYFSITGIGPGFAGSPPPLPKNIWVGVTAENQTRADERIPILLQIPAAVRWISCEPLLGPVNLRPWLDAVCECGDGRQSHLYGAGPCRICGPSGYERGGCREFRLFRRGLDWVVAGGETGPGARPVDLRWLRSLRDQCVAACTPFFFKQWGEYVGGEARETWEELRKGPGWCCYQNGDLSPTYHHHFGDGFVALKVGRKAAGQLLDGRVWNEMPARLSYHHA